MATGYRPTAIDCGTRPDLHSIIQRWPELPEAVKAGILGLVETAAADTD